MKAQQQHDEDDDAQSGAAACVPARAPAVAIDDDDAAFLATLRRLGGGAAFVKARGATTLQLIRLRSAGVIELSGESIGASTLAKITPRGLVAMAAHPGIIQL